MIVLYIILFITSIFFYILYKPIFSFYLFAFLLILPAVLFVLSKYSAKRIKTSFSSVRNTAGRDSKLPLMLKVENGSKLPVNNLLIEVEYYSTLDEQKNIVKINTPVFPSETQYLMMNISARHYGTIKLRIKRVRVCDMLRLFKVRVPFRGGDKKGLECTFTIIPDSMLIENNIDNYAEMGLETDEYSKHRKGDDPSEIFEIREYADGDKISRIHWKLTAKEGKTMVKDYSLPISNSIVILIDLNFGGVKELLPLYDTIVETVAAFSFHLISHETPHRVMWYDKVAEDLVDVNVVDEEAYRLLIKMLLEAPVYSEKDLSLKRYLDLELGSKCGHLMYLSPKFSEEVTELMSSSETAVKYSYLPAVDENTEPDSVDDEYALVVPVVTGKVAESIEDICL